MLFLLLAGTFPIPCLLIPLAATGRELGAPSGEKAQPAFSFPSEFLSHVAGEAKLTQPAEALAGRFWAFLAGWDLQHWAASCSDQTLKDTSGDSWSEGDKACLLASLIYMVSLQGHRSAHGTLVRGSSEKKYEFYFPAVALCTNGALRGPQRDAVGSESQAPAGVPLVHFLFPFLS